MSSKSKLVTGPLSSEDKVYIVENRNKKTLEELAKKVKRSVSTVENYLIKLDLVKTDTPVETPKPENFTTQVKEPVKLVTRTGPATVFDGGETVPFIPQPPEKNPFAY